MSKQVLKLVGMRIRDLRKERNWSQEQLAEKADFHFSYIGGIERAEKNISMLNLEKIANALEVEIYDLFAYSREVRTAPTAKEKEVNEIVNLLLRKDLREIRKAKNILLELFE
jgi:transcriptional regulator with XRE-family HTH domain